MENFDLNWLDAYRSRFPTPPTHLGTRWLQFHLPSEGRWLFCESHRTALRFSMTSGWCWAHKGYRSVQYHVRSPLHLFDVERAGKLGLEDGNRVRPVFGNTPTIVSVGSIDKNAALPIRFHRQFPESLGTWILFNATLPSSESLVSSYFFSSIVIMFSP